jgi:eukaryotic-like serine/threonine-protein kinase
VAVKNVATPRFRVVSRLGGDELTESLLCRLQGVEGFEKEVLVKRLSGARARDRRLAHAFLDQIRVLARLSHGNIIQIFEVGEDEEGPYAATEYVKGVTLQMISARASRAGKMHYGHVAKLLSGACDALAYLHGAVDEHERWAGVVHRDVSLAGIVVSMEGIPKLHDLAVTGAEPQHSTDPEANAEYARRVDVFGVGATLFKMTTGTSVWRGAGHRHADGSHPRPVGPSTRPSEIVPGYPAELEQIVLAAMEAHAAGPCPLVQDLGDRLLEFAADPAHRSAAGSLTAWLRELFPDLSTLGQTAAALLPVAPVVLTGATPPRGWASARHATPGPGPSRPGRRWQRVAFLAAALVLVFGGSLAILQTRSPSASLPTPAPPPPAPLPPPSRAALDPPPGPRPATEARVPSIPEPEPRRAPPHIAAQPPAAPPRRTERPERAPAPRVTSPPRRVAMVSSDFPAPPPREPAVKEPLPERPAPAEAPQPAPSALAAEAPSKAPASAPAPAAARPAMATTTPSARPERLVPTQTVVRASSGPAISATPRSPVPIPALPRVLTDPQPEQVARACQAVESAAVSLAGVSPEFARGVTGPLRRALRPQSAVYPIAMYYFVVREAALKHDSGTAAANLVTAQSNGTLVRFKDLPGIDRGL